MKKEPTQNQILKQQGGCPCGMKGKCCNNPKTYTPSHTCSGEVVCEECYQLACSRCGSSCYHEL
jgi:hypothetical protein